jgi:cell fate regulator YaaT (PSP1 superfamily)
MPTVVGIRFKATTKVYYFDPAGNDGLKIGEYVIVETTRGVELGRVVITPQEVPEDQVVGQLKPLVRRATAWDLMQMQQYRDQEPELVTKCRQRVKELQLPMKVIRAEQSFDGTRITFFFVSEQRVDFRQLVKDLAKTLHARIELRQVGVRDEAKLIGGLGKCGQVATCCSTFLTDFHPVSIKMAKQQDLPLSPAEISGICGRLLCCLAYENDLYVEAKKNLPRYGELIESAKGNGKVISVHVLRESVTVELMDGTQVVVEAAEVTARGPQAPRPPMPVQPERRR